MVIKTLKVGTLVVLLLSFPGLALGFVTFDTYTKTEFSPYHNESFPIPITLQDKATVTVRLYTADGDLVRSISGNKALKKGNQTLMWDGKDDQGNVVPDEAYVAVLKAITSNGKTFRVDPRENTGGEVVENLQVRITSDKQISYVLPASCRVLIRAGIKGGPMMRSLASWEPHSAGKNIQRWDGMDESRLLDLRNEKGLSVLVTAFQLPAFSIITIGNKGTTYADYRKKRGWPDRVLNQENLALTRGDMRIAREYYVSPSEARDPQVQISLSGEHKKNGKGLPVLKLDQSVRVKVDVDEQDRWLLDQSLYEVAFFVDHEFVSEEEQGYLPLTWLWKVNQLKEGQHVLTVNISGFTGKVGVVSTLFEVEK